MYIITLALVSNWFSKLVLWFINLFKVACPIGYRVASRYENLITAYSSCKIFA